MTCKGSGGKKKKFMYYLCSNCSLYLREDLIEDVVTPLIMSLVEYDMTVKKYFFPVLADKKEKNTAKLDKDIATLQAQKDRIKDAYLKGIVQVEDFSADYKIIEEKLDMLEQKRIAAIDINKQSFSPQALMADRDVAKEKLIRSNNFYDKLLEEWNNKSKEEKQEFISKFIESLTVEKDKNNNYKLVNLKVRNNFAEQICKLIDNGMFDVAIPVKATAKDDNRESITASLSMDKKELQEYIDRLNDYYEVSYYEFDKPDESKTGYQKKNIKIQDVNDKGEKFFKLVEVIGDDKKFPTKDKDRTIGEIRVKERVS